MIHMQNFISFLSRDINGLFETSGIRRLVCQYTDDNNW